MKFKTYILLSVLMVLISEPSLASKSALNVMLKMEKNGRGNDPVLLLDISRVYAKRGGEKNAERALVYLKKAAEAGSAEGAFTLHNNIIKGARFVSVDVRHNDPDYWLEMASKLGHKKAILKKYTAIIEDSSDNIEREKAFKVIEQMSQAGNTDATISLARMHYKGITVPQDSEIAISTLTSHLDKKPESEAEVQRELAKIHKKDEKIAKELVKNKAFMASLFKSAEAGHPASNLDLGTILMQGGYDSKLKGIEYIKKAVKLKADGSIRALNEAKVEMATPVIYNFNLYKAQRSKVMKNMKSMGVELVESNGYMDIYSGSKINGAKELIMAFDVLNKDYLAQMTFSFNNVAENYVTLFKRLRSKYGKPDYERVRNGSMTTYGKQLANEYHWKVGAAKIRLRRKEGEGGFVRLEYLVYPFIKELSGKITRAKRKAHLSNKIKGETL